MLRAINEEARGPDGLTLAEVEKMCAESRKMGAPDDASFGVQVMMSWKVLSHPYAPITRARILWPE